MRLFIRFILLCCLSLPAVASPAVTSADQPANLTVLTDDNLLLPLAQIARRYSTQTHTPLTVVVTNAEDAEHQIEQGLEAHILVTANYPLIARLSEQGLTDVTSRKPVARTALALVTASGLHQQAAIAKRISFAAMLAATPNLPVYVDAPETLDGSRAALLLSGHEFSADLTTRIEVEASHDEVLENLRDGEGLGLLLASDAVAEKDITILALLPEDISPAVTFDAVVLGSESMAAAKNFTSYLRGHEAEQILSHYGFQLPAK